MNTVLFKPRRRELWRELITGMRNVISLGTVIQQYCNKYATNKHARCANDTERKDTTKTKRYGYKRIILLVLLLGYHNCDPATD